MGIEERLERYADLTDAERSALAAEFGGNPGLEAAQKLNALLRSLTVSDAQVEDALKGKADPFLNQRFQALMAVQKDAATHFEETTGQKLSAGMQIMRPKPQIWRYAIAACLTFVMFSAVFYIGSQKPDNYALASIDLYHAEMQRPILRGGISNESLENLYYDGLADLEKAHQSFMGLFLHYDAPLLNLAIQKLTRVTQTAPAESVFQTEGYFFLAKAYLAKGDLSKAKEALRWVIALNGAKSNEAQKLLKSL